jgi:hypothetical protein
MEQGPRRRYRLKVVEVTGVEADVELRQEDADALGLRGAFEEASRRYAERRPLVERFGNEYHHVFPDPVVVEVDDGVVRALIGYKDLPVRMRFSGRTYLVSLEAGCG